MEFKGNLDKKNALGIWTKKFVKLTALKFTVSDSEDGAPIWSSTLTAVTRGVDIDVSAMTFFGEKANETIILRGKEPKDSSYWYNVCFGALEAAGKVKPRLAKLPTRDPRFDLAFKQIPDEYACSFLNLEKAVLYWFGQVVKFGLSGTFKSGNEDRCVFIGDKCLYVTKPNSEVTRCMKINQLTGIFTSVGCGIPPGGEINHYVVFKMAHPEYDLQVSGLDMAGLIEVVSAVYKYLHKGMKELPVKSVKLASDPSVGLQLTRPKEFEQTVVRPVTKEQLKSALDAFAAKHGIVFESAANTYGGVLSASAANSAAVATKSAQNLASAGAAPASSSGAQDARRTSASAPQEDKIPATDPLGCFLLKLGLERYYKSLFDQNIDIDVLECMDDTDMKNFGLKDPKDMELIRSKVTDSAFMDEVKSDVASAQKNAKWQPKKAEGVTEAPAPAQTQAPAPAPKKAPINFFDDSDDDILGPVKDTKKPAAGSPAGGGVKMAFNFDDSDDDLLAPAPKKAAPAKKPIDLDDDDI